jgi:hypothetical protein
MKTQFKFSLPKIERTADNPRSMRFLRFAMVSTRGFVRIRGIDRFRALDRAPERFDFRSVRPKSWLEVRYG